MRQEGEDLLELIERVRRSIRDDRAETAALFAGLDPATATRVVRAFTTYFYLANVAEQVHRGRELHAIRVRDGTWLSQAVDRIAAAGGSSAEIAEDIRHLGLRPVFTAHPTEAARRTVLSKMRRIAALLDDLDSARRERGRAGRARRAPQARRADRPAVADRRAAARAARRDRRGQERDVLLRRAPSRRRPGHPRGAQGRAGADRRRDAARGPPAHVRHVDRRRPRRQPERHGRRQPRSARAPARPRDPRRAGAGRRAARRALQLRADRRRHAGARGLARGRPRAPRRARAALPPAQRRGALPAQADLRPPEAAEHAQARAARAGPGLPRTRPSCSRISSASAIPCSRTAAS